MTEKKQTGGLSPAEGLIQPGDAQEVSDSGLVDTVPEDKSFTEFSNLSSNAFQVLQNQRGSDAYIVNKDYDEYSNYIDRSFSFSESDIEDTKNRGQGLGEKITRSAVKLPVRILTNVAGSTVGLVYGAGAVASDFLTEGPSASNLNKFFNNDFQRSLDDINESVDKALPHLYTSQEQEMGFWQSAFGAGAANFWTNDFTQGLAFVAGAVISEFATAGMASALIPAKAANNLKRVSALRNTAYAQKSVSGLNALKKIDKAEGVWNGLTQMRRLATGAFYEAGVESRHHYDSVVQNLVKLHIEKTGNPPTEKDEADIRNIAVQTSNSVFAVNAALVGYSNMLMFPTIFGKGVNASKKSFAKSIKSDMVDGVKKYKAAYKDFSKFRNIGAHAYNIAKTPFYEGFIEEGGQKLADISGQYAAEHFFRKGQDPSAMQSIGELLNHTDDAFSAAYGSAEGQKEIGLGVILAALGLPAFTRTNKDTGNREFGLGWSGGVKDYHMDYMKNRTEVDGLVKYMNSNPIAMEAIKVNFDNLVEQSFTSDERDFALATNNDYAAKNADHDAFFSFVHSRIKGGYFADVADSIEEVRSMDNGTFAQMFGYEDDIEDMTTEESNKFLDERKNEVADTHLERATRIKDIYDNTQNLNINEKYKKGLMHAYSSAHDIDQREERLIEEIEEKTGSTVLQSENRAANDEVEEVSRLQRLKNFTLDKLGFKAKEVLETSKEGKAVKEELGIKEFTEPSQAYEVFGHLAVKAKILEDKVKEAEANKDGESQIEAELELEEVRDKMLTLTEAFKNGLNPELSSEDVQLLEDYKKKDPTGYSENKESLEKKLIDLRHLRSRRHQMLNLVQQLVDPEASKDKIQQIEKVISDIAQSADNENLDPDQKSLARKYQGKLIEFEYTKAGEDTPTKYRAFYKDNSDKGVVLLPEADTFKLLKRLDMLKSGPQNEDTKAEIDLINEELEGHITEHTPRNADFLQKVSNITVLTEEALQLEGLNVSLEIIDDGLVSNIDAIKNDMESAKADIKVLEEEMVTILSAIQNAKTNKAGALYVNLNAIGRKGSFGITRAKEILQEVDNKIEEIAKKMDSMETSLETLESHAGKLRTIAGIMSSDKSFSDAVQDITEFLGTMSDSAFYKKLADSGVFSANELLELSIKGKDTDNVSLDEDHFRELLEMVDANKIVPEYLDLMHAQLDKYRSELNGLKEHRDFLNEKLKQFFDENGKIKLFPEGGLNASDMAWIEDEISGIETDLQTLTEEIDKISKEMEAKLLPEIESAADAVIEGQQELQRARELEGAIQSFVSQYIEFITDIMYQSSEANEEDESNPDTRPAQEEEEPRDQNYSPSLLEIPFTKTIGNHAEALTQYSEYQEIINSRELTAPEKMHYEHIMSQLRFFKHSEDLTDWSKANGDKLMVITRNNIPEALADQIIFFDHNDKKNPFKYAPDLKKNSKGESNENIKLVVVDKNLNPVLVDGKVVYTDMPTADLFTEGGMYRFAADKDLKEDCTPKEAVLEVQNSHRENRTQILSLEEPAFYLIKGKSKGLPLWENGNPASRNSILGRIVQKEEDLKDVSLLAALGTKGETHTELSIGGQRYRVRNGFLHFATGGTNRGVKGNMVPAKLNELSGKQVNNVYNILRLFASNQMQVMQGSLKPEDAAVLGDSNKGATKILKELIYFGAHSKNRAQSEYSIYFKNNRVHFGDNSVAFEALVDQSVNPEAVAQLKTFLGTLLTHVNTTLLSKDQEARIEAANVKKRLIAKAKGKAKTAAKAKKTEPEYTEFIEVIVDDSLNVTTQTWANYTEFLTSPVGREVEDIPVKVNMPLDSSGSKDVEQATVPQFLGMYLKHDGNLLSADNIDSEKEEEDEAEEVEVETTVGESGEIIYNEYKPTKTEEEVAESLSGRETVTKNVVDKNGDIVGTIEIIVGTDEEALALMEDKPYVPSMKVDGTKLVSPEANPINEVKKDALGNAGFTSVNPAQQDSEDEAEEDSPFMLQDVAEESGRRAVAYEGQLAWFNANMPTDMEGNPLFSVELVQGLIDGKAYGKFLAEGKILISDMMDVPGVLYHEAFHGITRKALSPEERYKLYDEVRAMKGKARTHKGEVKNLAEFTDKEADEWLAEEFREYVLSDGEYSIGNRVEKSFLDRIFDRLNKILNFFINNPSKAQELFDNIHGGQFSKPMETTSVYSDQGSAYMEVETVTASTINNVVEGMTVKLFDLAAENDIFSLEDFYSTRPSEDPSQPSLTQKIAKLYGGPGAKGTVYNKILGDLSKSRKSLNAKLDNATKREAEFLQVELDNIEKTYRAVQSNWNMFISHHAAYLKRLNIDTTEIIEDIEESERGRDTAYDIAASEVDPNSMLPAPVRLLLSTLPATKEVNGKRQFVYNSSGIAKVADFGSLMAFMYKNLSNQDPNTILDIIKSDSILKQRPELRYLVRRLGIESDNFEGKSPEKMRMIIQTVMQFDKSNNTYWTQMVDRQGGRYLLDSNSERVDSLVKKAWQLNFRNAISGGSSLGSIVEGKLTINPKVKIKLGTKSRTLEEWSNFVKTAEETLALLGSLGIKFSNPQNFMDRYEDEASMQNAVKWVLKELSTNPNLSDLFEGDIEGNLQTLIAAEVAETSFALDLQHRNPNGKTVYGVSLKTHLDVMASKLNSDNDAVLNLLTRSNLSNSRWLGRMAEGHDMSIHVLEGVKDGVQGRAKALSHTTPADIAVMHVNAILSNGIMPMIRTADKKTEYGVKVGTSNPGLVMNRSEILQRLTGYLVDEIRTANTFHSTPNSRMRRIKTLQEQGGDLRFFKGILSKSDVRNNGRKLSENKIQALTQSKTVQDKLDKLLDDAIESNKVSFQEMGVIQKGSKGQYLNLGLNQNTLDNVKELNTDSSTRMMMNTRSYNNIIEQFTYEHLTGVNEMSKLFLGDLALYKDLFKRTAGVVGTKIYPTSDLDILAWMNENMPNRGFYGREHSATIRTVTREDVDTDSPYVQQYVDVLSVLNPGLIETIKDTYEGMEEFDGGGFMHLDSYRSLLFRAGKWSDLQENFYQKIMDGADMSAKELAYFPPLKPQVLASFVVDNIELKTFHKYALFPLIPQIMPGKAYDKINEDMVANDVDYQVFASVVKVGAIQETKDGFDPFYESNGDFSSYKPMSLDASGQPLAIQKFDFSDVGIQLDIAPKVKYQVTAGTQLTSLLPLNIYEGGQLAPGYAEKFESLIDEYHHINSTLVNRDLNSLIDRLGLEREGNSYKLKNGNAAKLRETILEELSQRELPQHTRKGIMALLDHDVKFINQLYEKDKIEGLLFSIVTNSVIRRKMPGDMMVLQASTGLEIETKALKQGDFARAEELGVDLNSLGLKPLEFYRKPTPALTKAQREAMSPEEIEAHSQKMAGEPTLAMQVMVPHRFKEILGEHVDVNDPAIDPALLEAIGFRIPTEGLNSVDFIEIVGFLPPSAGSVVIVPTEVVGKSGADYDIDKLTMYFPNYTFDHTGFNRIPYLDGSNSTPEERLAVLQEQEPATFARLEKTHPTVADFTSLTMAEQNTKKALQNKLQNTIKSVLEDPISFDQLITPVGSPNLKTLAKEISDLRIERNEGIEAELNFRDQLSFGNLVNTSYRMWAGLGGTGIVATSATQHAKAQRAGLAWSPSAQVALNFRGFEGNVSPSLSRVSDINGSLKVSSVLGEYITGYVDVTKEDFVFDINAGVAYAPIHMMLIRSGVPLDAVAYFMSQPIIDEYVKSKEREQSFAAKSAGRDTTNKDLESSLKSKYGQIKPSNPIMLNTPLLREMVGRTDLSPVEMQIQVQVLDDFLRYKEYADDLFLLNTATKFDTSKLKNSIAVRYMQASLARVKDEGRFTGVDTLLSNSVREDGTTKPSMLAALKSAYDASPNLFKDLDLKAYHQNLSSFIDKKVYEFTDPDLYLSQDDVVNTMNKFDNFLSSYIIQNTPLNGKKLNSRISELFQGENSLPARILRVKDLPKFRNNLLIQELHPTLQAYTDPKHAEYDKDNLRLFSKKLQVYDVDLLADAFMELKEVNPGLARDIIEFSVLQSGLNFSPTAFFQVLPSLEVLDVISPHFRSTKDVLNLDFDMVYEDFMQNSWGDGNIVPRARMKKDGKSQAAFAAGKILLSNSNQYVTLSMQVGEEVKGISRKTIYETKLFRQDGVSTTNTSKNVYIAIPKKGDGQFLVEAGVDSILKKNRAKFGVEVLKVSKAVEQRIENAGASLLTRYKADISGGNYTLPGGARVDVTFLTQASKQDIYKGGKEIQKQFGIFSVGKEALEEMASNLGYASWQALSKDKANKSLVKGTKVTFYGVEALDSGKYSHAKSQTIQESISESDITDFSSIQQQIDNVKKEKDNCNN